MEFDLHSMNQAARDLLSGVERDAELMREHGNGGAADRAECTAERLTGVSAEVRARLSAMPDHAGLVLSAALDDLERNLAASGDALAEGGTHAK